jgi:hypothetical protein
VESTEKAINLSFQWTVGDTRELEKNLTDLVRSNYHHVITVASRFVAFGLTYLVAHLLLPNTEVFIVLAIVLAASWSIWVSWGMSLLAFRAIERLSAKDPRRVGWNNVTIDCRGIVWSDDVSQEYMSWLGIADIVERDGSLWIKTGAVHGYYLPPRVFSSDVEVNNCMKLIEEFRKSPAMPVHLQGSSETVIRRH